MVLSSSAESAGPMTNAQTCIVGLRQRLARYTHKRSSKKVTKFRTVASVENILYFRFTVAEAQPRIRVSRNRRTEPSLRGGPLALQDPFFSMACLRVLVRPGRPAMLPRLRSYAPQWQTEALSRRPAHLSFACADKLYLGNNTSLAHRKRRQEKPAKSTATRHLAAIGLCPPPLWRRPLRPCPLSQRSRARALSGHRNSSLPTHCSST